jgi:soluble lytic murein transglycosylase-like protein
VTATRLVAWQRVSAYALLSARRADELQALIANCDLPPLEAAYLGAMARGLTHPGDAARGLSGLWWTEPDTIWGLGALRALVELDESLYDPAERAAVVATIERVTPRTYRQEGSFASGRLAALQRRKLRGGRLGAELVLALGVYALHEAHFAAAAALFEQALLAHVHEPGLRRVLELRLGETRQGQGEFALALRLFERVAAGHNDDTLTASARAAEGQMALEQQRYHDAERLFMRQLLDNPTGTARASALFGLGWVAFRTGAMARARQFFVTGVAEDPVGRWAPAAAYWSARARLELGDSVGARTELTALVERFPDNYYAYRARERLLQLAPATATPGDSVASAPSGSSDVSGPYGPAGAPHAPGAPSAAEATMALEDSLAQQAHLLRPMVSALAEQARAERLPLAWLVGAAYAKSGLQMDRLGSRGELGLFQLTRATLASLAREEMHHEAGALDILDTNVNLRLSVRYFARLARPFGGRLEYALAAVDAGPAAVTRWRETRGDLPSDIFVEEIPRSQTRAFVRRALTALAKYRFDPQDQPSRTAPLAHK